MLTIKTKVNLNGLLPKVDGTVYEKDLKYAKKTKNEESAKCAIANARKWLKS